MTDLLEEAQYILSREHMPRDENTFTALWHVIRYLRATAPAATVREDRPNPCYWCALCSKCLDADETVCRSCGSTARATEAKSYKSYADPTGTYADKRGKFAEEKPAEAEVSSRVPSAVDLSVIYHDADSPTHGWFALWEAGRSSAARELAERDERIRVLESAVDTLKELATWAVNNAALPTHLFQRAKAIPANLRPGAEREGKP